MKNNMEGGEEEAILGYGGYYVQSPSSVSHANSTDLGRNSEVMFLPYHHNYQHSAPLKEEEQDQDQEEEATLYHASRASTRCSSSRVSFNSFTEDPKKMMMHNTPSLDHSCKIVIVKNNNGNAKNLHYSVSRKLGDDRIVDGEHNHILVSHKYDNEDGGDEEEEEDYFVGNKGGCWKYLSMHTYPASFVWIAIQLIWRFFVSFLVALLVFYLATKPPPPHFSVQVAGVNQFELTEGVDSSGVGTNFLTCNVSVALVIDNKSRVFGLHVLPSLINMYFARVPFVASQGSRVYVGSHHSAGLKVYVGVTSKAMYGAGRNMQDMLNSGKGMPTLITLSFKSYFKVFGRLIQPTFHHNAHCLLAIQNFYDKNHKTQSYNTTCSFLTC